MENVNFQPSGEEIERALMDLGPLLGVSIKEEVPEELPDGTAPPAASLNVSSTPDGDAAGCPGDAAEAGEAGALGEAGEPGKAGAADSLASPGAARALAADTRCVLCHAVLVLAEGTPKLMECLHSACESCIRAKLEEKQASSRDFLGAERVTITCPACRLQCQVANMIDQRFVLEKMALDQAGSNGAADAVLRDLRPAHVSRLPAAAPPRPQVPVQHRDGGAGSRADIGAAVGGELQARVAGLRHEGHPRPPAAHRRQEEGARARDHADRRQVSTGGRAARPWGRRREPESCRRLTNAINTRGKQLVLRLNEVCDAKQRTLSEKKEALQQLAAITDHCVAFVAGPVAAGSDTAVLHAKRAVTAHLQRIKSRRADIPNPEIPVRIALALDKLPELCKVLGSLGAIVVDGKLDGAPAAPAAQGPYHPPAPPAPPAPAAPPHSAVVALQHVAMQQVYPSPPLPRPVPYLWTVY
ncbi:hypothetical protein HF086_000265 [Spodoptera exigua]|uniref:RING-type domain-containing protein n=1 Tax=Spodoptera exigua TaxID=7107 RepID=A0A922M8E2_SPOEX|nr:hypothetical protein HF086_000265 [Spodoptera exigua]